MLFQLGKYRYELTHDQLLELNEVFKEFSSGQLFLKPSQLIGLLKTESISVDEKELEQISALIFKEEKKMCYNVYEFIAIVGRYKVDDEVQLELRKVFAHFDSKNRGKLTAKDIKGGLHRLGELTIRDKEVDRMFIELDLDADGAIDFEEFMASMIAP